MLTVAGAALLGRGLTADVYAVDGGVAGVRALKLFHPGARRDSVMRELEITRAVHAIGAPAPAVFDVVTVEGRLGILFERIPGHSLVREVERRPWRLFAVARQLADLHARLHELEAPAELPTQHDQIARWIDRAQLSAPERSSYRQMLDEAPRGTRLCHGDHHPGNVILSPTGPILLDWSRATRGAAILDVARTSVLFSEEKLPAETAWHVRAMLPVARGLLHRAYLRRYAARAGIGPAEVARWRRLQQVAGRI